MQSEVNVKKQEKIDITTRGLKKLLGKMPNWKSPDPDLVQGFWLENFSSLHERVRLQLKECLDSGFVPNWLNRGRTSLLQKDKNKGNIANKYRPLTFFGINVEVIDRCNCRSDICTFTSREVVTEEQKRYRKGSRGTNDLLYIDRAVIKEVKSRNKNLAMAWIDYKKAYNMVPH